jgi:predicted SnoaL-like aldol condensation-catalyzing enzyme
MERPFDKRRTFPAAWRKVVVPPLRHCVRLPAVGSDAGKTVLLRMLEMFVTGDLEAAPATVAPDYRDHQGLGASPVEGVNGFCEVVRTARSSYVELDVWPEALMTQGDEVTARLHWQGTLPTGVTIDRETMEVIRVAEGLAVEHWVEEVWVRESAMSGRPD